MGNNTPPANGAPPIIGSDGRSAGGEASPFQRVAPPRQDRRLLEVKLSKPRLDQLIVSGPLPRAIFARVSSVQSGVATEAPWEEAVKVNLTGDADAVLVSVFGADSAEAYARGEGQLVSEVVLPYQGSGSLRELGVAPNTPSVDVRMELAQGAKGQNVQSDQLGLSARELPLSLSDSAGSQPQAASSTGAAATFAELATSPLGKQLVKLELENQLLRAKAGIPENPAQPSKTVQYLQAVQQENLQLNADITSVQGKIDRTKAHCQAIRTEAPRPPSNNQDWGRSLNFMRKELELLQKRKVQILRNYEERAKGLVIQIKQYRYENQHLQAGLGQPGSGGGSESSQKVMEASRNLEEAVSRRDRLSRQLREASKMSMPSSQGSCRSDSDSPEVRQVHEDIEKCRREVEGLKQEMALRNAAQFGSQKCQELADEVQTLREEMTERQQMRTDERVRAESEVQELKAECNKVKDLLDVGTTELQYIQEKAKVLRSVKGAPGSTSQTSAADLIQLRREAEEQTEELELLKSTEQARMYTIQDLNKEFEQLEEQALQAYSQSQVPRTAPSLPAEDFATQLQKMEEERQLLAAQELKLQGKVP